MHQLESYMWFHHCIRNFKKNFAHNVVQNLLPNRPSVGCGVSWTFTDRGTIKLKPQGAATTSSNMTSVFLFHQKLHYICFKTNECMVT